MKLVAIDHVPPISAPEIAQLLLDSGFDARYDTNPRMLADGSPLTEGTTPIYVPAEQVEDARVVLGAYYQEARAHSTPLLDLPAFWNAFGIPTLLGALLGVVSGLLTASATVGAGFGLVGFISLTSVFGTLRHRAATREELTPPS